ncbi:MAG: hypothetical protein PHW96_03365 [Candidatus Nanoarchaeia archaeon]|nr:hypothetical protein [Candidatus Nanoarchaeia archaeon]
MASLDEFINRETKKQKNIFDDMMEHASKSKHPDSNDVVLYSAIILRNIYNDVKKKWTKLKNKDEIITPEPVRKYKIQAYFEKTLRRRFNEAVYQEAVKSLSKKGILEREVEEENSGYVTQYSFNPSHKSILKDVEKGIPLDDKSSWVYKKLKPQN